MAGLELRFLGDFEVRRDGQALPLPPSKKTRALLAYLCLQPRRFRREQLCELLWEVPDDPLGSLRWSLSKLRRLLDDKERSRVLADRVSVGVETEGVSIDMLELRLLVEGDLAKVPIEALEAAATRYRGNVLEGLEFSNFHDFHSWCVAEREQSLRDRAALLTELVRRRADEPELALPHVRALVGLSPYEESHRATLIRLLNAARQFGEAEEQFQLGLRILKEAAISGRPSMGCLAESTHRRRQVKVSGLDVAEVGAALDIAQRHAMLHATDRGLDFAHELIARAVYNDISPLRRQVMHRRIAELLEKDTAQDLARAADLAHHATLSGDPGLAARAMVSAGRLCLRFFANDDALSLARKGLQLAETLSDAERVCAEIDLQEILLAARPADDWDAAARHFAALAERALDHGALAHARLGYHMASWVRWTQGQWTAAREQTLQAARAVRGGQDEAQIVGMAETAKCLVLIERDISRADAMLMEASALAQRKGFSHHAIAAGLGMLRFYENRLDEAEEFFREARTLCKSAGDRVNEYQANEYLVMLDFQRGNLAQARARCEELMTLGDKLRGGSEEPFARAMAGLCTYAIDDAVEGLEAALTDLRIADAKHRLAYILTRAALLDCERGRVDTATKRATEALRYATLLERATELLLANAVLSRDCLVMGDRKGAAKFAKEVERLSAAGAAAWTHDIAARLASNNKRAARKEAL